MIMGLEANKIYNIDCLKGLSQLGDNSVDFAFTDPPFGIKFHALTSVYFNKNSRNDSIKYKDYENEKEYSEWSEEWIKEIYRVIKHDGAFCLVSGWSNVSYLDLAGRRAGFKVLNHVIWKYEFGLFTKKKFTTSHYHVLCFVKTDDIKKSKYFFKKQKNYDEDVILDIRRNGTNIKGHPCALPPQLVEKFVKSFSREGDLVLDIFMGSGTTALVARNNNRNFIGFEISKDYMKLINKRLVKAKDLSSWIPKI
jgi:site-specific DNA-methyltransferase (adenine-specific)